MGSKQNQARYWARSYVGWSRVEAATPNPGHLALAKAELTGQVLSIITQNVDGLHQRAGSRRLIELHGNIHGVLCLDCRQVHPRSEIQQWLLEANPSMAPSGPVAEANIWNDPHSADFVFTAGWKLTMVGLDVTHQLIVPLALFKKVADHHKHIATDTLHHAVSFYADFYSGIYPHVAKIHGCFGHDVLAFVALTNPELFEIQTGRIRVATEGPANGQTMMRRKDIFYPQPGWGDDVPDTHACLQLKADEALQLIETTLMSSWL